MKNLVRNMSTLINKTYRLRESIVYTSRVTALFLGLFFVNSASANLIASYDFTGDATDGSGNGHNGTVIGASLTADRFGNANNAFSFGDDGDHITIGNGIITSDSSFSVSAWIARVNTGSNIGWDNILVGPNGSPLFAINETDYLTMGAQANNPFPHTSAASILDTGWHHVVGVHDAALNQLRVYLDNVLVKTDTVSADFFDQGGFMVIGARADGEEAFSG